MRGNICIYPQCNSYIRYNWMVVNTFSHKCVNWNSNRRPSLKPTMQQKQWTIILFCFCSGCIMTNEMINESSSHYRVRQSWGVFFLSVSSSVIASSDEINHVLCNSPWSYSYSISSCEDLTHRRQRLGCEIRKCFFFIFLHLTDSVQDVHLFCCECDILRLIHAPQSHGAGSVLCCYNWINCSETIWT